VGKVERDEEHSKRAGVAAELHEATALARELGPEAVLDRLYGSGLTVAVNFTRPEHKQCAVAAVHALRSALGRAVAGDATAWDELRRIASPFQVKDERLEVRAVSPYAALADLCARIMRDQPIPGSPGWLDARAQLANLDPQFATIQDAQLDEIVSAAQKSHELAIELVLASGGVKPRAAGESAERHEKRVRQAFADARSKASPARRAKRRKI
jgi:hypothetical protein